MTSVRGGNDVLPPGLLRYFENYERQHGDSRKELDALWQALDGTLEQYFVSTATWGLEHWENELGITIDASKPVAQRRSVILSKLRGIGTVTVSLIKSVAEAYDGGSVEVTLQPEAYTLRLSSWIRGAFRLTWTTSKPSLKKSNRHTSQSNMPSPIPSGAS